MIILLVIGGLIALAATLFAGTVLGAAIVLGPAVRQQDRVPNWKKDLSAPDWLERIHNRCVEKGAEYVPIAGTCGGCGRHLLRSVSDGKHFGECANLDCARMGIRVPVRTDPPAGVAHRWTCGACGRPLLKAFGRPYPYCVNPSCRWKGRLVGVGTVKEAWPTRWTCSNCGRSLLLTRSDGRDWGECINVGCPRSGVRIPVRTDVPRVRAWL